MPWQPQKRKNLLLSPVPSRMLATPQPKKLKMAVKNALKLVLHLKKRYMDSKQVEKWRKVKEALEKEGKTDNPFYKRAVVILRTGADPGSFLD